MLSVCAGIARQRSLLFLKVPQGNVKRVVSKYAAGSTVWTRGWAQVFGKYLLVTNTLSAGVLMCIGDLVQQELEHIEHKNHESFDWIRNRNMGIVGLIGGSFCHYFYQILDIYLPGIKMFTIARKILLDQTIASPVCIIMFFYGMNYLNGESLERANKEFTEKCIPVYTTDCCVWIPSQLINFYCLPPEYRVIYINLITMCYNVFLSYMKHKELIKPT